MNNIMIIGAGRAGRFTNSLATLCNKKVIGFLDDTFTLGDSVDDVNILGTTDDILTVYEKYNCNFLISITHMTKRSDLLNLINRNNIPLASLIHPTVIQAPKSHIGKGCIIQPYTTIQTGAIIEDNVLIEERCSIGVDVIVGENTVITPGVSLSGGVEVQPNCFIGTNSCVNPEIIISCNTTVGSGSTVVKTTEPDTVYAGSPAKLLKYKTK